MTLIAAHGMHGRLPLKGVLRAMTALRAVTKAFSQPAIHNVAACFSRCTEEEVRFQSPSRWAFAAERQEDLPHAKSHVA